MVEPAITWGSSLFYRLFHHEPVRMSADPLTVGKPDAMRDPYESNQAIPTLLVVPRARASCEIAAFAAIHSNRLVLAVGLPFVRWIQVVVAALGSRRRLYPCIGKKIRAGVWPVSRFSVADRHGKAISGDGDYPSSSRFLARPKAQPLKSGACKHHEDRLNRQAIFWRGNRAACSQNERNPKEEHRQDRPVAFLADQRQSPTNWISRITARPAIRELARSRHKSRCRNEIEN